MTLAWGRKVASAFRDRVSAIVGDLLYPNPSDLMACMAWESGRTSSASIHNAAGSGAVGLIQFMPQTAALLHATTEKLAEITAIEQLDYVDLYFRPWRGKLHNLCDVYCAILWPADVGKADNAIQFDKSARPTTYLQNKGLDADHDGDITRAEVAVKVLPMLTEGLLPANLA